MAWGASAEAGMAGMGEPEGQKGVNEGYLRPATQPGLCCQCILCKVHQEETHKHHAYWGYD